MTVERNINKRWEQGSDHHPKSISLFKALEKVDLNYGWKSGGDGDNGELFMYQLDIIFECEDAGEPL